MAASESRTWKKIGLYYALALAISCVFWRLGHWTIANITLLTGFMWSPALAAVLTKWMFGESVRDLGWTWGSGRYQGYGYLLPVVYAVPVYVAVWLTGLGGFYDQAFLQKTATDLGLAGLSPTLQLIAFTVVTMTAGFIPKLGRALGEEIGWRGFLVPELSKATGIAGTGLISGLMWAAWHFPVILFGDYNAGTPDWYALTTNTGHTAHLIDEFGAGLAITTTVVAVLLWRKSGVVPQRLTEPMVERARA